jgi:5,10-methylene-tetrahydrofolate dehydrogenase/methenyl tetrahydrofolate cyclohydrolase
MPAKIIDGNKIAKSIIEDIKNKVKSMKEKPGLALVLVGNNPASISRKKTAKKLAFIAKDTNWIMKLVRWIC